MANPNIDGSVYFITDDYNHVKIGVATDVAKRLKALQTANPNRLRVLAIVHFDKEKDAYGLESALHDYFRDMNLCGEWFVAGPVFDFLNSSGSIKIGGYEFNGFRDIFEEFRENREYLTRDEPYFPEFFQTEIGVANG